MNSRSLTTVYFILIAIIIVMSSCHNGNREFDKKLWMVRGSMQYTYRDSMVKDLLKKEKLIGTSYRQMTDLLGQPDFNHFAPRRKVFYLLKTYYGLGVDARGYKTLDFDFTDDSTISDYRVSRD